MSSLIPVHASEHVLGGVSEYLATAFSLANPETSNALKAFLEDTERGMFHGPYVRVRLPYARAIGWDGILDWMPSWFTPYHHQTEAFRRLRSRDEHGERRPDPTLVITGTGSGKTESFLYPVLDHAARARAGGHTGVKALLLYPMNALANDHAKCQHEDALLDTHLQHFHYWRGGQEPTRQGLARLSAARKRRGKTGRS